jgi:hypothetical protein
VKKLFWKTRSIEKDNIKINIKGKGLILENWIR